MKVSVVVPCFNEQGNIAPLKEKLEEVLKGYDYEVIFVNDGSRDETLPILEKLCLQNKKFKLLSFSRNFGHQVALKAGLDHSNGSVVISLDADLQHPPELIPELIKKWEEGYLVVQTIRDDSKDINLFKRVTSTFFYKFINALSDVKIKKGTADFRLLDERVINELKKINEKELFFRGIIPWLGFKTYYYSLTPQERSWGVSQYSLKKMMKLAINGITSFSVRPLYLSTLWGLTISGFSFIYSVYAIFMKIVSDHVISGWTSLLVSVLFIGGVQLIFLGILGQYLGRLFLDSKQRPPYVIEQKIGEFCDKY